MAKVTKTFQYGQHTVTLETGEIARQASSVIVKMDAARYQALIEKLGLRR